MSKAYLIGHITVKDPEKWSEYRSKVPATLEPWGGDLVFRGSLTTVLAGRHSHGDTVVIRFPDIASLTGWYSSSQYQSLLPIREAAADMDLLSFEE